VLMHKYNNLTVAMLQTILDYCYRAEQHGRVSGAYAPLHGAFWHAFANLALTGDTMRNRIRHVVQRVCDHLLKYWLLWNCVHATGHGMIVMQNILLRTGRTASYSAFTYPSLDTTSSILEDAIDGCRDVLMGHAAAACVFGSWHSFAQATENWPVSTLSDTASCPCCSMLDHNNASSCFQLMYFGAVTNKPITHCDSLPTASDHIRLACVGGLASTRYDLLEMVSPDTQDGARLVVKLCNPIPHTDESGLKMCIFASTAMLGYMLHYNNAASTINITRLCGSVEQYLSSSTLLNYAVRVCHLQMNDWENKFSLLTMPSPFYSDGMLQYCQEQRIC